MHDDPALRRLVCHSRCAMQIPKSLPMDIAAGVSVAFMVVPQGISYADLAGVPPVWGLYGAFVPVLVYAMFGSSRHLAVGPVAVTSILIGKVVEGILPDSKSTDENIQADVQDEQNHIVLQVRACDASAILVSTTAKQRSAGRCVARFEPDSGRHECTLVLICTSLLSCVTGLCGRHVPAMRVSCLAALEHITWHRCEPVAMPHASAACESSLKWIQLLQSMLVALASLCNRPPPAADHIPCRRDVVYRRRAAA